MPIFKLGVSYTTSFYLASIPLPGHEAAKYLLAAFYAIAGHLVVSLSKHYIDKMMERKRSKKQ